jgi:nicotinamidase-related amidase
MGSDPIERSKRIDPSPGRKNPPPPVSLDLTLRTTALVLIDLQKGIVARALAPHSAAEVVDRSVQLGRRFNEIGAPVVLVHVAFAADGADRLRQPVDAPTPVPPGGFPPDWSDFVPEVTALRAAAVITKRQWGAFYGTDLDPQLRRRGIDTIVLAGIATNYGVESTAREGWQHGYAMIVAEDACSSMDAELHRFSIEKLLPRIARIRPTSEILSAVGDAH